MARAYGLFLLPISGLLAKLVDGGNNESSTAVVSVGGNGQSGMGNMHEYRIIDCIPPDNSEGGLYNFDTSGECSLNFYDWIRFVHEFHPHCVLAAPSDQDQLEYFASMNNFHMPILMGMRKNTKDALQCFNNNDPAECLEGWYTLEGEKIAADPYLWYGYGPDGHGEVSEKKHSSRNHRRRRALKNEVVVEHTPRLRVTKKPGKEEKMPKEIDDYSMSMSFPGKMPREKMPKEKMPKEIDDYSMSMSFPGKTHKEKMPKEKMPKEIDDYSMSMSFPGKTHKEKMPKDYEESEDDFSMSMSMKGKQKKTRLPMPKRLSKNKRESVEPAPQGEPKTNRELATVASTGSFGQYKKFLFDNSAETGFHYAMVKCHMASSNADIHTHQPVANNKQGKVLDLNIAGLAQFQAGISGYEWLNLLVLRACGPKKVDLSNVMIAVADSTGPAATYTLDQKTIGSCETFTVSFGDETKLYSDLFGAQADMNIAKLEAPFGKSAILLLDATVASPLVKEHQEKYGVNPSLFDLKYTIPHALIDSYGEPGVLSEDYDWDFTGKLSYRNGCYSGNQKFYAKEWEYYHVPYAVDAEGDEVDDWMYSITDSMCPDTKITMTLREEL
ncbi:hypothetical protein ACA910_020529 [Epithemia clementina (nom. ined.)]